MQYGCSAAQFGLPTRGQPPSLRGRNALSASSVPDSLKDFIRTLAPMELRPAQYSVLVLIGANPGRSQAAIGQALNIERARLARMLHDLEGRQWIERRVAADDGRSHSLFLTAEGRNALKQIKKLTTRHELQISKFVGSRRRTMLLNLLKEFG